MSITLLCLVKENTTANAFAVDIDSEKLVSHLKDAIKVKKQNDFAGVDADKLKLWKVEIGGDHLDDQLKNLKLNDSDELSAINDIGDYWPTSPPKKHIHVIVKLPLLSLEEALSCVPPPLTFRPNAVKGKSTTNSGDFQPVELFPWEGFFEEVNNFKFSDEQEHNRPNFIDYSQMHNEMSVQTAFETNICEVLNKLLKDYDFSRESTKNPGDPDFICRFAMIQVLIPIEVKRKHILEDIGEQSFIQFHKHNQKAQRVIRQIYSYMVVNQVKYGILSTYDNHWFLRRPGDDEENRDKLWISDCLPLQSHSPSVLKAYAYVTKELCKDPHSTHTNIITVPADENNDKRVTRNTKKSAQKRESSDSSSRSSSDASTNTNNQNLYSTDFKFKDILSQGRSGKTLLCEFRNNTIALKCADLWKSPSYILKEMQNEVRIYQLLSDLQGKYIPNLKCYGYFENGMCYVIGTTLIGNPLSYYKHITERQKVKGILALKAIHDRGVLHNDIREENILLDNRNNDVYLIDFGMSSFYYDVKKSWRLFNEEKHKLNSLLDRHTLLDSVVIDFYNSI